MPEPTEATQPTEQAEKWMQTKYTQEEVGYTDYAVRRNPVNSVCQTCRWFIGHDMNLNGASNCHIVECYPLDIVGTGYCNEWTARKIVEPEPLEVVIVESDDMDSEEYEVGTMARYGVDVSPVVTDFVQKRRLLPDKVEPAFKLLSNGKWIAFFTNNFEDQDTEILMGKAHEDYVARANAGLVDMPELWRGHIKGTRHGQAERLYCLKTDDAVTVFAIGTFDATPAGKAAQRFYKKAKPGSVSLSHGFLFPTWAKKDGAYKVYNTFEITTLRRGQEANQFTSFSAKGMDMPLTAEQIADLKAVYGDAAPEMLDEVAKYDKGVQAIVDMGVKHKGKGFTDFADMQGGDTTEGDKSQDAKTLSVLKGLLPTLFEDTAAALEAVDMVNKKADTATADATAAKKAVELIGTFEARLKALEALLETAKHATPASESTSTVVIDTSKITPELLGVLSPETKAAIQAIQAKQSGNGSKDTVESMLLGGK